MTKIFPKNIFIPENILNDTISELDNAKGIVPAGVIFDSIEPLYTRGLTYELQELERRQASPNSTWQGILDRDISVDKSDLGNIIGITELNDAQNKAIRSALSSTVTVVTGPPGTGRHKLYLT